MANVLSLALKINADASGLNLTPVERALKKLGEETDKVTGIFDKFSGTSEAAAAAQERTAKSLNDLTAARLAGTVTATQYAEQFEAIAAGAREEAAALQRAAQITEQNLTSVERYDRSLSELDAQLQAGRISQETYTRATENAAKGLTAAERAARGFETATEATADNAARTTLQFNELSGVFAILPGPLGNPQRMRVHCVVMNECYLSCYASLRACTQDCSTGTWGHLLHYTRQQNHIYCASPHVYR